MDEEEKQKLLRIIKVLKEKGTGDPLRLGRLKDEIEKGQELSWGDKHYLLSNLENYNNSPSIKLPKLNFKSPVFQFAMVIVFVVMFVSIGTFFYEPEPEVVWVITRTDVTPHVLDSIGDYGTLPEDTGRNSMELKFTIPKVTTRDIFTIENYSFDWYVIDRDTKEISFIIKNANLEFVKSEYGTHKANLYYKWEENASKVLPYPKNAKTSFDFNWDPKSFRRRSRKSFPILR